MCSGCSLQSWAGKIASLHCNRHSQCIKAQQHQLSYHQVDVSAAQMHLGADKPGFTADNAPWPSQSFASMLVVPQNNSFSFSDLSDIVCPTKMKTQHYCTPTWMLFLLLAFALLDAPEPKYFPARQAQPTSPQSSHPLRQGPGLPGNLTEAPVHEQHQQLPGQLLCLIPSVVICAGQQGRHCQTGPQH
jgi:hypothetical protein